MAPIYFFFFSPFFTVLYLSCWLRSVFFFYRVLLEFRRLGEVDLRSTSTEFYGVFFFLLSFTVRPYLVFGVSWRPNPVLLGFY